MKPTEAQIEKAKWIADNLPESISVAALAEALAEAEKPPEGWIEVRVAVCLGIAENKIAVSAYGIDSYATERQAISIATDCYADDDLIGEAFVMRCWRPPVTNEVVEAESQ